MWWRDKGNLAENKCFHMSPLSSWDYWPLICSVTSTKIACESPRTKMETRRDRPPRLTCCRSTSRSSRTSLTTSAASSTRARARTSFVLEAAPCSATKECSSASKTFSLNLQRCSPLGWRSNPLTSYGDCFKVCLEVVLCYFLGLVSPFVW